MAIVSHAIALLRDVRYAVLKGDVSKLGQPHNPTISPTAFLLLDIILLEGVYPCLSDGVGVPKEKRTRSVSQLKWSERDSQLSSNEKRILLFQYLDDLGALEGHGGVQSLEKDIQERTFADRIAILCEIGANPTYAGYVECNSSLSMLSDILSRYSLQLLCTCDYDYVSTQRS